MQQLRKISLLFFFLLLTLSSFAWWGPTGHRVVGQIADSYLSKKARAAIREILGNETVAMSSNWADLVKSDSAYNYLAPWHYINAPQGLSKNEFYKKLENDTAVNAYNMLNFMIAELKNKNVPLAKKQIYLHMLIHVTGDIHQPLHVGQFEDLGGNKIRLQWFGENTNLHSLWDEKIVEFQKLSYTEFAKSINHTTKDQRRQWQQQPMAEWFYESYLLAGKIYASVSGTEPKLSFRYNYDHVDMMNSQLLKAGVRLAGLLNAIFG